MLEFREIEGFSRYRVNILGEVYNIEKNKFVNSYIDRIISLWDKNLKKTKTKLIHRLIAQAFIPNPDPDKLIQINHKDGNKLNNTISNLEWCTNQQNAIHAHKIGLKVGLIGEDNSNSKLSEKQILEIRSRYENGNILQRELGEIYGVGQTQISRIVRNKLWKNI